MIKVLVGDLFASRAQTLVNTVNCVGVMGKGIALEFKRRFPEMHEDYLRRCKARQVKLGRPYLYRSLVPPWILNFPTKDHWRSVSKLEDIVRGLRYLEQHYRAWGITSLAVPPLGCGHGQLEWRVVGPTVYRHLKRLDIPVELYAPYGTAHEELQPTFLEQPPVPEAAAAEGEPPDRLKAGWVALVKVVDEIEREPYHHPVGRTAFQKIAYFATDAGIPTGLSYRRGSYGPYAPELKAAITRLVNNGLLREERLGRMFVVKPGPTFQDACRAYEQELTRWRDLIDRLADLFMRMTTQQAEIAATVHLVARELTSEERTGKPTEKEVLAQVMQWKQKRRPPLDRNEVARTIRGLGMLGWLDVTASSDLPVSEEAMLDV
ncbi:MAG TPA: Appr-1-p processing protein [Planctomycetes bacterium]|nr:Appr-1-p processing protein [Planctomycetota bacterium]